MVPSNNMPAYSDAVLSDTDIADIYAFLQSLQGRGRRKTFRSSIIEDVFPAPPLALADHVINALAYCSSVILPENWNPFFGIML